MADLVALTRRVFLRSAAPALAATSLPPSIAVVLAPTPARAEAAAIEEDPELITTLADFDDADAAHRAATAAVADMIERGRKLWPVAPEILRSGVAPYTDLDTRCRITGGLCIVAGRQIPFYARSSDHYRHYLDRPDRPSKSERVRRDLARFRIRKEREMRIAEAYEAECERVRRTVNYQAVIDDEEAARFAWVRAIRDVQRVEARTPYGVGQKARVLLAEVGPRDTLMFSAGAADLARNVRAIVGA